MLPTGLTFVLLSGCMSFQVAADAPKTAASSYGDETIHGSFYGFRWARFEPQKCDDGGLAEVQFVTTAVWLVASVVTLGLWVPQDIEWWCADTQPDDPPDTPVLEDGEGSSWTEPAPEEPIDRQPTADGGVQ